MFLSILTIAWSVVSAICMTLAFIHIIVWVFQRELKIHLLFAVAAFSAAVIAVGELLQLHETSVESFLLIVRYMHIPIFFLLISIVWFIDLYFGTARRWLTITISAMWIISLIINFLSPHNLTFTSISHLERIALPWGEYFSIPVGVENPWKYIADFASLLIVIFVADATINLWKKGNIKRASIIGSGILFFIISAGIHTPLVDAGIIETPYLISFSFFGIIIAMSFELVSDIIKIPALNKEIITKENRWKLLLNKMNVAILEIDREGSITYSNPFFTNLFGVNSREILGKNFSFLLDDDANKKVEAFSKSLDPGKPIPPFTLPMLTSNGEKVVINWQNVKILNSNDQWVSSLSIGTDFTQEYKNFEDIKKLKEQLEKENISLREERFLDNDHKEILGKSDAMKYTLSRVNKVAPTDTTVLIEGETGVGKELIARAIHRASDRKEKSLIKVNCAVIPANLLESELFGHEKGAYTGADKSRKGRFEYADGATLFLDEIGELPLDLQTKLLRVLEEGEFERLGSNKTIKVDVRIIAATNRILFNEISKGNFRKDLYYRLSAYPISISPLREKIVDIPILVNHFVDRFSRKLGKNIQKISTATMNKLKGYHWPGNIRELRNVLERAVITSSGNVLIIEDELIPLKTLEINGNQRELKSLEAFEKEYILEVLNKCNWKINGKNSASEILDLHPNTLRSRMKKLEISKNHSNGFSLE